MLEWEAPKRNCTGSNCASVCRVVGSWVFLQIKRVMDETEAQNPALDS